MLTRQQILALIPHQGMMCLLDRVAAWSAADITCGASSHLSPDNPLRRDGRLGAICGIEYGLQAAALHGASCAGERIQAVWLRAAGAVHDRPALHRGLPAYASDVALLSRAMMPHAVG